LHGTKSYFHDLRDAVTVRYERRFENHPPDWDKRLAGPADRIAWIKERLGRQDQGRGRKRRVQETTGAVRAKGYGSKIKNVKFL